MWIDFLFVVVLGLSLGAAELMGRYSDSPVRIFMSGYAWIYLAINGGLAALSLFLIQSLDLNFTLDPTDPTAVDDAKQRIFNVIAAGLGGAAFFRAAVMKTKVGGTDVAIGPAFLIDTLLTVTDREVDRFSARRRADDIAEMMSNINLDQASQLLIPFCTALMQNVTAAEREDLRQSVLALGKDTSIDSQTKPMLLGLKLVDVVGFAVLQSAVDALRDLKLLGTAPADQESLFEFIRDRVESVRVSVGDVVMGDRHTVVGAGGADTPAAEEAGDAPAVDEGDAAPPPRAQPGTPGAGR
jgi:hypothetical protein